MKDQISNFSFCESIYAGPLSPWHIRRLTDQGRKLGGGIDSRSLCQRVLRGWDLDVEITESQLGNNICSDCLKEYLNR